MRSEGWPAGASALAADRLQVHAAGDEGHLMAGPRQQPAIVAAEAAGAHDGDAHLPLSLLWGLGGHGLRGRTVLARARGAETAQPLGELFEAFGYAPVQRPLGVAALRVGLARRDAGEDLQPLVYRPHRPEVEVSLPHRVDHFLAQHQVAHVLVRDEHALSARETDRLADVVEPFHLFVHAADGLDLAALVHRSGDGNPLVDRRAGQFTEEGVQLGGGSGVTLHLVIALLEGEGRGQAQRPILRISPPAPSPRARPAPPYCRPAAPRRSPRRPAPSPR